MASRGRTALLDGSLPVVARFEDWKSRESAAEVEPAAALSPADLLRLSPSEREAALKRMALEAIDELRGDVSTAVDMDTPVAELGLDSVNVVELLATMEEQCGVVLPMEELAQGMTLRQLVSAVSEELQQAGPATAGPTDPGR
jgi:acyl carrier protein